MRRMVLLAFTLLVHFSSATTGFSQYKFDTVIERRLIPYVEVDNNGVVWINGDGGNLFRIEGDETSKISYDDFPPFLNSEVIAFDSSNTAYFGGTVTLYSYDGNCWKNLLPDSIGGEPFINYEITAILAEDDGSLWAGTFIHGLLHYNGETWSIIDETSGLGSNDVRSIAKGTDGILWVGTSKGLSRFYEGEWNNLTTEDGVPGNYIAEVVVDKDNVLWCNVGRLARYKDNVWTTYDTGLRARFKRDLLVNNIAISPQGEVWVSEIHGYCPANISKCDCTGIVGGVSVLRDGKWISYTKREGLPKEGVKSLAVAPDGEVYIGTICGCYKFDPDQALAVETPTEVVPEPVILGNYPNPFNPVTTIQYSVPKTSNIEIEIRNTMGQFVRKLSNTKVSAGIHEIVWNGKDDGGNELSSGMYFVVLKGGVSRSIKQILLIR